MVKIIRLRKGLNINLAGKAPRQKTAIGKAEEYALTPDTFVGVTPKVVVKEGERVKAGSALFVNKNCPQVSFASPVSGTVTAIERGERRKVLSVKVKADDQQEFVEFGVKEVSQLSADQVVESLLQAGLFGFINQLPYAVSTTPDTHPKGIFVSALRDKPLACDFEYEVKGQEDDFVAGLIALSKIAPTHLGLGIQPDLQAELFKCGIEKYVTVTVYDGKCPAGNVGVQVNHTDPVNKGEVVWMVEPTAVIFFGRLFRTGRVNMMRTIAIAGSEITEPAYADVMTGTPLTAILDRKMKHEDGVRIIQGNPLTGSQATKNDFLGAHTSTICVLPEGDHADELLGWIMPRWGQFSASRSYFSWLQNLWCFGKKKQYNLDTRVKGGERHMIMSGEYDRVLPMDIYGEYLIKAIIAGDIDKMEQLGIYEVSPEDFALAEFVDSSKLELQKIVRNGLDMLRKENA